MRIKIFIAYNTGKGIADAVLCMVDGANAVFVDTCVRAVKERCNIHVLCTVPLISAFTDSYLAEHFYPMLSLSALLCCCCQTYMEASPTKLFEECTLKCGLMPSWNPTVLEYRVRC